MEKKHQLNQTIIFDLLKKYKLMNKKVAIELNGRIVSKQTTKKNI